MPEPELIPPGPQTDEGIPADAPRVLVIDDNEALRLAHARILKRHGYRVATAEDAETALVALRETRFDLIVSDIMMPRMTGTELVDRLRASHVDIPVVFITGNPLLETAMKAVEQGVTRYLTKPVERQTLVDAAGDAIRLHGLARAQRLALDNECLRSLVDEMNRARAAEQTASRVKSDFLSKVSHELRTPLTGIMGFIELALTTDVSPEQRQYLETSQRSATALFALIQDILQFSSLNRGAASVEADTIVTRTAFAEALAPLIATAESKGLSVTVDIDEAIPPTLTGDGRKLRQVLEHIVGNAIKFTRPGGRIAVRAAMDACSDGGDRLRVSVSDSGVGFPEAARARLFEPFSQADNSSTREYGGVGLGLTISALLVQLMGGSLTVDSKPAVGTTVTFTTRVEPGKAP